MKIVLLLTTILLNITLLHAQVESENRKEQVEKIVIAYITKKLDLTVDEAQQFWPVYNKFTTDLRTAVKEVKQDEIKKAEATLAVQKRYQPEFKRILKSDDRSNQVFVITRNLKDMAEKRKQNNGQRMQQRRQGQGRGF